MAPPWAMPADPGAGGPPPVPPITGSPVPDQPKSPVNDSTIPMFSPEGAYAEVPVPSYQQALTTGFKPARKMTSPEARVAVVPQEKIQDALKLGFADGPPEQQPKTKMFSPANEYNEVPNNSYQTALKNGYKPAKVMTSPLGHELPVPPEWADAALKTGWKLGPPEQQEKPNAITSLLGGFLGVDRHDVAARRYADSPTGKLAQQLADQDPANAMVRQLPGQSKPVNDTHKNQAQQQLKLNPQHVAALQDLEARAEKGIPWEDKLAEGLPIVGPQIVIGAHAVREFKKGNVVSGLAKTGAAALPVVGPMAEASGEAFGRGDVAEGVTQGTMALLPFAHGVVPKAADVPRAAAPKMTATEGIKQAGVKLLAGGNTGETRPIEPAAGKASHAEVADYAASKGIDLTPAQATQSKPLQAIQAVGERALVGGKPLQELLQRQHGQVADAVQEFQTRVGNEYAPDPEAVGEHLKSQAAEKLQGLKDKAQGDYQTFKEQTGGQGFDVDLSPVVDKYQRELQSQGEVLKNVPEQFAAPIRNMLEKVAGIKSDLPTPEATPVVKMDTAQQLRSYYLDIARDRSGNVPSRVNRLAAQAAQDIDAAMEKSAGPNAETWRRANQSWRQLQETYNDKASPLTKLISEPDPQKVTASLLAKGRFGGNSRTVRLLNQNGYDLSPLRHQVVSDVVANSFKLTNGGNGLGGYQLPFLKELFEPADLQELLNLGRVARATKFELNPSGTSNVMEALSQMGAVAKGRTPSLLGAGAGFALGGPVGAAIGAGGAEALGPAAAARFSANPRNVARALGRPTLEAGKPGFLRGGPEAGTASEENVGNLRDITAASSKKLELIGTVDKVKPSPVVGWDLVTLKNPDGLTSVMRLPAGKYQPGDLIRGSRLPLNSETIRQMSTQSEPQPTQPQENVLPWKKNPERGSASPDDLDEQLRLAVQRTSQGDTAHSQNALRELYPDRQFGQLTPMEQSAVMRRAQELKSGSTNPVGGNTEGATLPMHGPGAASVEELSRGETFWRVKKNGQLSYNGNSPDANLQDGEALVAIKKDGNMRVQNSRVMLGEQGVLDKYGDQVRQAAGVKVGERGSAKPEDLDNQLPMVLGQGNKVRVTQEPLTNHTATLNQWRDSFFQKRRHLEQRAGYAVTDGLLNSEPSKLLVAKGATGEPLGYMGLGEDADFGQGPHRVVEHLVISPDLLRENAPIKGVGSALMKQAAAEAAKNGEGLVLYPSQTSKGFYQKLGLTKVVEGNMALSPEATKRLADQRGSANMDDINGELTAVGEAQKGPVFYSNLERTVNQKLPARFSGDQALATLRNAGVKADELQTVEPLLKGSTTVTKQQLLDHVRENNLASQVQDVWKTSVPSNDDLPVDHEAWQDARVNAEEHEGNNIANYLAQDQFNKPFNKLSEEQQAIITESDEYNDEIDKAAHEYYEGDYESDRQGSTKYTEHQLPGGENYRELLLQLPEKKRPAINWGSTLPGGRMTIGNQEIEAPSRSGRETDQNFQSSHWDEPNVLGHLRMNDRTDVNGKKTLFLEEVQSDWHQQGRREGYQPTVKQLTDQAKDYTAHQEKNGRWHIYDQNNQQVDKPYHNLFGEKTPMEAIQAYLRLKATAPELTGQEDLQTHQAAHKFLVPDAPFKKDWPELLLKRALREAAEGGYDQLAWTPGDVQNERYDLSKHVDSVVYHPETGVLNAYKGGRSVISQTNVTREKLPDFIGKEVSQRLLDSPFQTNVHGENFHKLSGLDLKVGGAGMRGFYDKLVPDFLNKYGKKWGARVGSTEIRTGIDRNLFVTQPVMARDRIVGYEVVGPWGDEENHVFSTHESLAKAADALTKVREENPTKRQVPTIQITPKMRQDLLKGQPISELQQRTMPRLPMHQASEAEA